MCGRFTLQSPADALHELFGVSMEGELRPRFNVAPTQSIWAWRAPEGEGELVSLRWGLIPFFAKDLKMGARMINARSETVSAKPSFRAAFKRRRCLIAADGFIEWKKMSDGTKQPYHLRRRDGRPFAFAGLWERWSSPEGETIESATILTTDPNELVAEIHDRMPVILEGDDFGLWLDPQVQSRESLEMLFEPISAELMEARAVSRRVSNARNDDAACLEEITAP